MAEIAEKSMVVQAKLWKYILNMQTLSIAYTIL